MKLDRFPERLLILALVLTSCACDHDESPDAAELKDSTLTGASRTMADIDNFEPDPFMLPTFTAQEVPASDRSRRVIAETYPRLAPALKAKGLEYGQPIFIRIFKQEEQLELWIERDGRFHLFRTWPIARYSGELGPKLAEGDHQAPEGFYYVPPGNMNPMSNHLLAFNLGFPNTYDEAHGRTGSYLMVHGGRSSVGCYAMTDPAIAEIYTLADAALRNGQPFFRVHCFPFRMTEAHMRRYAQNEWHDFWINLKEGYDFFAQTHRPPNTRVVEGRYVFEPESD